MPGPSQFGTATPLDLLLIPATLFAGGFQGVMYTFDPTNFNDAASGSFYDWKIEDVIAGRIPTINRVIISYRDLGVASILVNLSGVTGPQDPNQPNSPVNQSTTLTIGTASARGVICTVIWGITLSAANLQLSVVRAANAGPVSITKVRLEGKVETTTY